MNKDIIELLYMLYVRQEDECTLEATNRMIDALNNLIAENKQLKKRLEIPERGSEDGIYCRDETIRLQDQAVDELKGKLKASEEQVKFLDKAVSDCMMKLPII